ncbi:dynamin family protein [Nannocystis sp.]|uniref:dynamin family protein n=1 Tax=Nannocystis sp. TaxID=1962667 RepID=UPI0025E54ADE|nr:dynamin family protein [Nannocystis sp.]
MTNGSDDHPKDDPAGPANTLRSVGSALGGWAKRVGKAITEVAGPQQPEEVSRALTQAHDLRRAGQFATAHERLQAPIKTRPNDPSLLLSLALTLIEQALVTPARIDVLSAFAEGLGKRGERNVGGPLVEATEHLLRSEFDASLDALRRARKLLDELGGSLQPETRFVFHLLTTLAQAHRGRHERALLELHKTRARLPEGTHGPLRQLLIAEGAQISLAAESVDEAIAWLSSEAEPPTASDGQPATPSDDARTAHAYLALALAAKGDRLGSEAALAKVDSDDPAWDELRIRIGLCLGTGPESQPERTRELALRHLQRASEDPRRQRLWALAEAATWPSSGAATPIAGRSACLDALATAARAAPADLLERHLHELAHLSLRADLRPPNIVAAIRKQLRDSPTAPEEIRLVHVRKRLEEHDEQVGEDFLPGPPPRFRAQADLGGPWGPDEISPIRDAGSRLTVVRSQRALASAELCLQRNLPEAAQEYLVEVLTEFPEHEHARALLTELARPVESNRLEDLLTAATTLLAAMPGRILGVPLSGVQDALSGVIAARERLARPLTIAIMGEFSSGKSTFINALLGEAVAPMGVLPTTSTINLFRRGPSGSARVHYRDGSIATVARDEVHTFLQHLDDIEASRIRHMEIERTGSRLGEAAVVDTPGLNALDTFHERVTREFVEEADAIIWIFSATRGGAASEGSALKSVSADGRQVLGVLNKVDTLDAEERVELVTYLREQFGQILLDVLPISASAALTLRTAEGNHSDDPFVAVEDALERHFFERARELKRSLTTRRLADALGHAREVVLAAADALDAKADDAARGDASDPGQLEFRLVSFADTVYGQILGLDDVLTRECLALGILRAGSAPARAFLAPQDATYLAAVLRDSILRALQTALADLTQTPGADALADVLTGRLVPWANGFLDSLDSSGFVASLVIEHGPTVAKGEAALRERYRVALQPVAASWRKFIRGLFRHIRQAHRQARHTAASAPRAEALRLRTTTVASLDAVLGSLERVAP